MLKKSILVISILFILTGCSCQEEKKEIVFSSWGSVTEVKILKQIISQFEERNPNINIKFVHIPQNYFQKIHLLFASKTAPDVVFINNLHLPLYSDYLEDLTDKVEQKEYFPQAIEGLSIDGKVLAIPRDVSNLVFYINLDLIAKPRANWTIDEMLKLALEAKQKGVYGISFEPEIYWMLPYLSYYGEVFDKNFDVETSSGMQFYKELRDKYKVAPTKSQVGSSTLAQMFLDGNIAMYLSGRWIYPKIKEQAGFNWMVQSFPIGESPLPCDCSGWAISKSSKNKEDALKFVEFLSSESSSEYFMETSLIVPARISVAEKLNSNMHNEKVFLEVISDSQKTLVSKDYKKLVDKFNSKI